VSGPARFRVALLAGLAVAVGGVAAPSSSAAAGQSGSFVALTYNVAGLPEPLSGSEPATNSPLIGPLLNAYDLVLLQENWPDGLHEARVAGLVGEEVPRTGYYDLVVAGARHAYRSEPAASPPLPAPQRLGTGPALTSDGLNRLSGFPFGPLTRVMWDECHGELAVEVAEVASEESGLEGLLHDAGLGDAEDQLDGGASDCSAQKGFSVARTELAPGVAVDVYNLHADASGGDGSRAARRAGFEQLAAYIAEHSQGHPIVLGGDTNLHTRRVDGDFVAFDDETWSKFLAATGLHDVCEAVDCGADAGRIDKFAFRSTPALTLTPTSHRFERDVFVRRDGEPLSDHDALAVKFAWAAGAASVLGQTRLADPAAASLPRTGAAGAPLTLCVLATAGLVARRLFFTERARRGG
jgi:hypothetical protein